ncbi:hypothetical protein C8F04DRAFT_1097119 [Mycena alexandri]|uniref:F-box domain-containing protein n=1 Tax=Mycena alexandri TaxID=1745969 RepID=A0AAD6X428_9AGAR|nr:hypothetical protein C8F04DRAFT_1097119 [Mycena alexandri]
MFLHPIRRLATSRSPLASGQKDLSTSGATHTAGGGANVHRHKSVAEYRNPFTTLRRMLPENTSEIFTWTLPCEQATVKHSAINATTQDSPWLLGRICSRWRTVALASRSLWSFIGIDCNVLVEALAVLDMQLQRATYLRIYFAGPTSFYSDHPMNHRITLLERLVECSPRWVEAGLTLTPDLFPSSLVGAPCSDPTIAHIMG